MTLYQSFGIILLLKTAIDKGFDYNLTFYFHWLTPVFRLTDGSSTSVAV